jgi:hypothetical protein
MPPRRRLEESRKYFEKLHSIYFTSERKKEQPRSRLLDKPAGREHR